MMNKVVRFKGNTRFVPKEAGNLYIDGDKAVLIDQAGHEFVFARYGSDGSSSGSGGQSGGAEYVESWPENPVPNRLYVTTNGARMYYGENGEYVELSASSESHQSSGSGETQYGEAEYVDEWPANPVQNRIYVTVDGTRVYHGSNGEYVEMASVTAQQSSGSGDQYGEAEYLDEWPDNPVPGRLYVTPEGARVYHGDNGDYVELASTTAQQSSGSGGTEYVDEWPDNPVPGKLYVTSEGARIYHGDNGEYVEFSAGGSQPVGNPTYAITTIPASTTEYILCDSVSTENNGSWQYVHEPATTPPLYTLQDVEDTTVEHAVILTVKFTNVQSVGFQDEHNHMVIPVNTIAVNQGSVVEYLCKYDPLQSSWVVMASPMN